ncbi:MAG: tetratricopeptide repeat protein [Planctomycetota bacterium]|jgi:tetratricopeptide (TPR) repeat protein
MDSQHRHELKTNELAEGLSHLPGLLKDNANTIIGVLLIATALITWPMLSKMANRKDLAERAAVSQSIQMLDQDVRSILQSPADDTSARSEALNTYLVNADELLNKAADTDIPNLAAMAQVKAAQAIRTELHLRPEVTAEMLESQVQKSADAYQKALETAESPTIRAMAQFGLGLCSEELGQTDQAADIYQQIIDDESYKATTLPTQAQRRLDAIEENSESFNFAEVPVAIENLPLELIEAVQAEPQEATIEPVAKETAEDVEIAVPDAEQTTPPQEQ